MVRRKFKWKITLFCLTLTLLQLSVKSLPISKIIKAKNELRNYEESTTEEMDSTDNVTNTVNANIVSTVTSNISRSLLLRQARPGQTIDLYAVTLVANDAGTFNGRVEMDVNLDLETREDPILLHLEDLTVHTVLVGVVTAVNMVAADFNVDDGFLEIFPAQIASSYKVYVEYSGQLRDSGIGFYQGGENEYSYLGMNLHPTYARRVFPCMDELSEPSVIRFTVNTPGYTHVVANSLLEDNSQNEFRALTGPTHLWGIVAHNFVNINIPTSNVLLYGRTGFSSLDAQASVAINYFFNALNEWTNKPYFEIILHQDGRMNIFALPDVDKQWYALSIVGIWEPYIFMETTHSIKHRYEALSAISQAMSNQWFGYVIYPENWRFEWVVAGLKQYAAFEMLRMFQDNTFGIDISLLDVNTLFVTEIIQESLLRDSYASSQVLEPPDDIFEEDEIRDHVHGLLKYKAPAILRMLRLALGGPNDDFIHIAARALLANRALQTVNSLNFYDTINSEFTGNALVPDVAEFLENWIQTQGYPLLHVGIRQGGVIITQEHFSLATRPHVNFPIPITFTTSANPNFDTDNIYPQQVTDGTLSINMALNEDDWVLFNIQGQGYYRVRYDNDLWERIIEALQDPDRREQIHPLNRATLVDDALNLARSGSLDYETAFEVILTMENEIEYAVWKAFIRNMNFLRKRLEALVYDDEDLDPDIYLRMVRRTVGRVEDEIGFYPDPLISEPAMVSLTRGLVMDHACRANYQPCIAAAVDWFYDPDSSDLVVNPNIPHDMRPAVYCTMMREGDGEARAALYNRLDIEVSPYERVVILESLACSSDNNFVTGLLEETLASNSQYTVEERSRIFMAVAEAGYENAQIALNFMSRRTNEIRTMYGGTDKLEEIIYHLSENMADADLSTDFNVWVFAQNNNLDDSQGAAERILLQVIQNREWDDAHMDFVYDWIDENDAPTLVVSLVLICLTLFITAFNH